MGQFILGSCRSKKSSLTETQHKIIKRIEQSMYLPGSLDFLPRVGMDKFGRLQEGQKELQSEKNLTMVFKQYCDYYLDLENSAKYFDKETGNINFAYFIRIYKTAYFWKKIRFEKRRKMYLEQRRGYLFTKDEAKYRQTVDLCNNSEENCLQAVLNDIYKLVGTTEDAFQASLHFYCQDTAKAQKITEISEYAQQSPQLISATLDTFEEMEVDYTRKDILRILSLLHKITIVQIKELKQCKDAEALFEEYKYLKEKVQDNFYMQTGLEQHEFKELANKTRKWAEQDVTQPFDAQQFMREYAQMQSDFDEIIEQLNSQIQEKYDVEMLVSMSSNSYLMDEPDDQE